MCDEYKPVFARFLSSTADNFSNNRRRSIERSPFANCFHARRKRRIERIFFLKKKKRKKFLWPVHPEYSKVGINGGKDCSERRGRRGE